MQLTLIEAPAVSLKLRWANLNISSPSGTVKLSTAERNSFSQTEINKKKIIWYVHLNVNSISSPSIDSVEFFLLAKSTETRNVILRALADMIGDPWTPPSAIFMLMLVPNIPDLIGL